MLILGCYLVAFFYVSGHVYLTYILENCDRLTFRVDAVVGSTCVRVRAFFRMRRRVGIVEVLKPVLLFEWIRIGCLGVKDSRGKEGGGAR